MGIQTNLLFTPTKWTDVATFFHANYVAHAATVKSVPGEPVISATASAMIALLFPASGIVRALSAIYHCAACADTPLKTALRAKALCTVVRSPTWKPKAGDVVECLGFRSSKRTRDAVEDNPSFEYLDWKEANSRGLPMNHASVALLKERRDILDKCMAKLIGWLARNPKKSKDPIDEAEIKIPMLRVKTLANIEFEAFLKNPLSYPSKSIVDIQRRTVHGVCQLPEGYALAIVPPEADVSEGSADWDDRAQEDNAQSEGCRHDEEQDKEGGDIDTMNNEPRGLGKQDDMRSAQDQDNGASDYHRRSHVEQDEEVQDDEEQHIDKQITSQRNDNSEDCEEQDNLKKTEQNEGSHGRFQQLQARARKLLHLYLKSLLDEPLISILIVNWSHYVRRDIPQSSSASLVSQVSSANNLAKGLIAIFQTLYAGSILYRVKGDQIEQYGFTAFGLTVCPYLIMSIVNLISILLTPDYPTTYLVTSDTMVEASKREGARFEGMVGSIQRRREVEASNGKVTFVNAEERMMQLDIGPDNTLARQISSAVLPTRFVTDGTSRPGNVKERPHLILSSCSAIDVTGEERLEDARKFWMSIVSIFVTCISIAIIGALSHFQPGHSTLAQRIWIMMWLACGITYGPVINYFNPVGVDKLSMLCYGAPSIGGFVVVGQMLMDYGHCIRLE